ncbi:hypothetical protein [Sulfuriferula sp.]|uniref:hypothetical protein n=1 Tax=Sulfuriferula sp. TaxID=2025307 RepID=UPI0027316ADC|nr:hypothetical protein [Sulfuriferula sp.]MDP2027071.1 hypothetical protein [Sulfuriferula sp.]
MKRLALTFFIPVLFSASAYADGLCQEEAKAMGYVGSIDTLEPCKPQKNAASEATLSEKAGKELEPRYLGGKRDLDSSEQMGQVQTR